MKIIEEFPNYAIDKNGIVYSKYKHSHKQYIDNGTSKETWKPLKSVLDKGVGYYLVTLIKWENGKTIKRNKFIHRLLCQSYIPNPENKAHVNHKDGNKTNNCLDNLEWATCKENSQHAVNMGLASYAHCERAIIQLDDTDNIIAEYKSLTEAFRQTGIQNANISKVVRGERQKAGGYKWKYKDV